MSKNVAILFFGIHYLPSYFHWAKWRINVNFEVSVKNYKKYLFQYFQKQGYKIDVFISSYHSEKERDLLKTYKPKKYQFCDIKNGDDHTIQRNERFLEVIDLCQLHEIQNSFQYDEYIITRFDLEFLNHLDILNIDKTKINIPYRMDTEAQFDVKEDNFYILYNDYFEKFVRICRKMPRNESFHKIHHYNQGLELHYMIDGFHSLNNNPLYKLNRKFVR